MPTEHWRRVWNVAAPLLPEKGLVALLAALRADSRELIQDYTVLPVLQGDVPVEGACLLGYVGWKGGGHDSVSDVQRYFALICSEIDNRLGGSAESRYLTNWWDSNPRTEVVAAMIPLVEAELSRRGWCHV